MATKKPTGVRFGPLFYVRKYAMPVLRVSTFVTITALTLVLVVGYQARAQLGEVLMGIGIEMLRYQGAERQEVPRNLVLNGQQIRISVGVAPEPVDTVLDFYEARCEQRSGSLEDEVEAYAEQAPSAPPIADSWLDLVLREGDESRGFVACIDTGESNMTTETLAAKAERMRQHMDLSEIGDMRFVYATESEGDTVFVILWTDGPFRVQQMFPGQGDAPGQDVNGVPRPPESQRLLSAFEEDQPQSMTLYASPDGPEEVEHFYREAMDESGWEILEADGATEARESGPSTLVFERGERMVVLSFLPRREGGSQASILVAR